MRKYNFSKPKGNELWEVFYQYSFQTIVYIQSPFRFIMTLNEMRNMFFFLRMGTFLFFYRSFVKKKKIGAIPRKAICTFLRKFDSLPLQNSRYGAMRWRWMRDACAIRCSSDYASRCTKVACVKQCTRTVTVLVHRLATVAGATEGTGIIGTTWGARRDSKCFLLGEVCVDEVNTG